MDSVEEDHRLADVFESCVRIFNEGVLLNDSFIQSCRTDGSCVSPWKNYPVG